ncbi:MAG: extracellular solute-binding protein [Caldilineaceae bacterium]|nr:extracellular solute-binding protein [Caldilineaceae bacterium]MCY3989759.1 extracellular solute-binding protein [Caldilineaceae bacterium]MDE0080677.1 extracellular solute-binding protein [Caldilineaceae bacterium]MDE0310841.1 extracellular solute-binding protein [Caldilineaceae bacterium]
MNAKRLNRRDFLKTTGTVTGASLLAACVAPAAPAPAGEQAAAEEPMAEEGSVAMWSMSFPPHEWMMGAAIEVFQEAGERGFTLDYQPQPGQYSAKLRAAMSADEAPDIFVMHGTALLELALAGHIAPVTPDIVTLEQAKREFMPETYLQSLYDGNLYAIGVPDPPGDAGLVANLDHLEEAGLEHLTVFENIDQMLDYAEQLVIREGDDILRAGLMFTGDGNNPIYWLSAIIDLGGTWFDNDNQVFTLQTAESTAAMQFFYDVVWEKRLDDPALGNNSSDALAQGLASLAFKWPEFVPYSGTAFPGLRLGFIVKPGFTEGKPAIFNHSDTWNLAVWSGTENKDSVTEFLSYCAQREVQRAMLEQNPGISPLKEINFNDDFFVTGKGAYLAPVLDAITKGQYRYYGPFGNMDTLEYDIMWPVMNRMLQQELTVEETLVEMENALNDEMAQYQDKYPGLDPVQIQWDGLPAELMEGIPMQG